MRRELHTWLDHPQALVVAGVPGWASVLGPPWG